MGHKRMDLDLGINKKPVLRVMKLFDLSPIRTIKVPVKNKDLKQQEADNDNLLNDLTINAPSQAWASDRYPIN